MDLEGTIRGRDVAEVLLAIGRLNGTGILTVQGEQEIIGISFQDGEVVSADALNQTVEEGLGEVLASRQLVRAEDLSVLAAEHQAGGGRVMDLLVERSYLTREELLDALRYHTYRLCRQVLQWRSGEYKFYRGEEVSYEEGVAAISVEELLIRSAQDLGNQGPLPGHVPESETVYRPHDGRPKEGASFGESLLEELLEELEHEARRISELVDGRRSSEEIVAECGMPRGKALLALYRLEQAGLIEAMAQSLPEGEPSPARPAPAPPAKKRKPRRGPLAVLPGARAATWLQSTPWTARLLAAGLATALVALLSSQPRLLLLPFPWQGGLRQTLAAQQRSAGYFKVDRAAKTFFLLEGRFPESLSELVEQRLLNPEDLTDPGGRPFTYSALATSYLIHPHGDDVPSPGSARVETVTGDFLLDPEFVVPELAQRPPLVLLD
ncbi:MAG: DUF4388 domain-containing protein [Thermoanaerobaculia bacterium]